MFSYFSSFIFIRLIHWKTYAFYVSWFFSVFVLHTWNQYEIVEEAIINSSLQFCSQNILQSPVTRDSTVYHSTQGILENESSDAIIYTFHPRLQINKHWRTTIRESRYRSNVILPSNRNFSVDSPAETRHVAVRLLREQASVLVAEGNR